MTEPLADPLVEIISAEAFSGGHRIACRFNRPYSEPVAPGGLYTEPNSAHESSAVHRVISRRGEILTFETYGVEGEPLPPIGTTFFYRGWWLPAAMAAALDTTAVWEYRTYPDDGNHDHCLFTWDKIAAYADQKVGWWSAKHGWATESAYENFIAKDIYRLRETHDA